MPVINGKYYTDEEIAAIKRQSTSGEFEKFLVSGVVAFATGSSIVGAVIGGSILGGLIGDVMEDDEDSIF